MAIRPVVIVVAAATALGLAAAAPAQQPAADPYTAAIRTQAEQSRGLVLRTAEKVPENLYSFKPTPEVRSLGAILGHIADGNLLLCGIANGDKPAIAQENEKKTTRAELIAALNESAAFCDKVFAATTDANGSAPVEMFGRKQPKLAVLALNNSHVMEHYGNLVTYMRLNKIVPPSSERPQ